MRLRTALTGLILIILMGAGVVPLTPDGPTDAAHATTVDTTFNEVAYWSGTTLIGQAQNQPHWWGSCLVQDFNGGSWGHFLRVATAWGQPIYTVRHGMRDGWFAQGGAAGWLRCPTGDEYRFGDGARQDFQGAALLWRPNTGALPVSHRNANAVGFAWSQLGVSSTGLTPDRMWSGWCERFVELAFGRQNVFPTAQAHYQTLRDRGQIRGGTPPPGTVVFWDWGTYDHVGISIGGGQVISTQGFSTPLPVRISGTNILPYLGWAPNPAF